MRSASNSATIARTLKSSFTSDRWDQLRAANTEFHFTSGEVIGNLMGVLDGPGQPVQFGDNQGIAGAAGGQRFTQAWPVPVSAREPVVDVDPLGIIRDASWPGARAPSATGASGGGPACGRANNRISVDETGVNLGLQLDTGWPGAIVSD